MISNKDTFLRNNGAQLNEIYTCQVSVARELSTVGCTVSRSKASKMPWANKWPPEMTHCNLLYNEYLFLLFFCSQQDHHSAFISTCAAL
jgi:hypothetical protein